MYYVQGALIVIIIILIYCVYVNPKMTAASGMMTAGGAENMSTSRSAGRFARVSEHAIGCRCEVCFAPERDSTVERMTYFSNRAPSTGCDDCTNNDLAFAKFDYGGPNMDFKDYVAADAVSPQVAKNHKEYVKDRIGEFQTQNITGRTFMVDTGVEADPSVPWVGIRGRPQHVPLFNPTQMPDVDAPRYYKQQKLVWNTNIAD